MDIEFKDQPLNPSLLDTSDDPVIAPTTLKGTNNRPMSSNEIINVSDRSSSSGSPERVKSNVAPLHSTPLPTSSNTAPELQPEGVSNSNTDPRASKSLGISRKIKLPSGIKTGVYMLSVNIERDECHLIPAERVEEGGQLVFHQTARIDNTTGKLIPSTRVSLSTPPRNHANNTTQTTQTSPQQSQSLPTPEFDTSTVSHTRADNREREHHGTAHTPGTDRVIDPHLGREPRVVPPGNIGPYKAHTVHMQTLGSYATTGSLSRVPILNKECKIVSSTVPSFPARTC